MATQKMHRRLRKAFDWIDMSLGFAQQRKARFAAGRPGTTIDQLDAEIERLSLERERLVELHFYALCGWSDAQLLDAGLGDLEGYQNWRRGSTARRVPPPMCRIPACRRCHDTGEVSAADAFGEYAGEEPCSCAAGFRARQELEADLHQRQHAAMVEAAEYATWQRRITMPHSGARVIDDLNAQPF